MPTTMDDNSAGTQRRRSLRSTVAPLFRRRGPAALLDQVLVSACNFLSGVVLVRGLGLETFGKYTIAYAILLYANSLQLSFVSAPMLSITPLLQQPERKAFLEGMYAVQGLSSLILGIAALAAGGIC